ncbi:YqzE family protein [Fictibacillus iocasae]|uniref:YqzE family protein n=1 Tax=Fictibacillus iocasae TaxID=2715437 RepID=A0ABW2NIB8_9BACL
MASGDELVKVVTKKIVQYMDEPAITRKERRMQRKQAKPPVSVALFGILPMIIKYFFKRK